MKGVEGVEGVKVDTSTTSPALRLIAEPARAPVVKVVGFPLDTLDYLDTLDDLRSKTSGSTGVPSHHRFTFVDRAIAKWRCGTLGGALPVVPT